MTGLLDGLSSVLSDMFGAPVLYEPAQGAAQSFHAVFREDPIEVTDAEGHSVLILSPTLRVPRSVAPDFRRGDYVTPQSVPGRRFTIVNALPSGSSAEDAFIICELEEDLS